jgi:hypothetical protein
MWASGFFTLDLLSTIVGNSPDNSVLEAWK